MNHMQNYRAPHQKLTDVGEMFNSFKVRRALLLNDNDGVAVFSACPLCYFPQ